ncbi:MAG: ABC transporter ATP-binding protein, partial [Bacteroidales bacterium]|nr:ABC transporter ATP-binding protein [Bacteroidales bacterium]
EPTNHLDMQSKDVLKNALLQYSGTLIVVSHDRDFLQGLTTKVFEFRNKKVKEHLGDIYDFLEYRKLTTLKELEAAKQSRSQSENAVSENKISYEQKKQTERDIRKLLTQIEKAEKRIADFESQIADKNLILSDPSKADINYNEISRELNSLQKELEKEMVHWEKCHHELDDLQK